jgi:hypothetical protein
VLLCADALYNLLKFPTEFAPSAVLDQEQSRFHLEGVERSEAGAAQTGADHWKDTVLAVGCRFLDGGAGAGACTLRMEIWMEDMPMLALTEFKS